MRKFMVDVFIGIDRGKKKAGVKMQDVIDLAGSLPSAMLKMKKYTNCTLISVNRSVARIIASENAYLDLISVDHTGGRSTVFLALPFQK